MDNNKTERHPCDSIFGERATKTWHEYLDYLYGPEEKDEADNE